MRIFSSRRSLKSRQKNLPWLILRPLVKESFPPTCLVPKRPKNESVPFCLDPLQTIPVAFNSCHGQKLYLWQYPFKYWKSCKLDDT